MYTHTHTCTRRAKQYLPFFQRAGKMTGVVDYVLSGHRLKVSIIILLRLKVSIFMCVWPYVHAYRWEGRWWGTGSR